MHIRRTKIVSTIGPGSDMPELIEQLIDAGVDYFRLNCSHGDVEWHRENIRKIRMLSQQKNQTIGILMDLQGPKIRVGEIEGGEVYFNTGDFFILTIEPIMGTKDKISTSYLRLPYDVKEGDSFFLDDGLLNVRVQKVYENKQTIRCEVIEGGLLKSRKGINLPTVNISSPSLTENDLKYAILAIEENVDYIALSFVRFPVDIIDLKKFIAKYNKTIPVVAKIERREALEVIDQIIEVADAILVARGDLGVEIPSESVPLVQKKLIFKCNLKGKPVITATQMLESMIKNPRPTRAEVSDVANAILDGTDAVMVSGETAVGRYPIEVVKRINTVAKEVECNFPNLYHHNMHARKLDLIEDVEENIAFSSSSIVKNLNAKAIIIWAESSQFIHLFSKFHPTALIIALTDNSRVAHKIKLVWGAIPIKVDKFFNFSDDKQLFKVIMNIAPFKLKDYVVIVENSNHKIKNRLNLLKIVKIGQLQNNELK